MISNRNNKHLLSSPTSLAQLERSNPSRLPLLLRRQSWRTTGHYIPQLDSLSENISSAPFLMEKLYCGVAIKGNQMENPTIYQESTFTSSSQMNPLYTKPHPANGESYQQKAMCILGI